MATAPGELGRRERKKLETGRRLRVAALDLALARGPEHVTVEDIADAADVSVRTFFNYFSAKEEAMVGIDPAVVDIVCAALRARPADEEPLEALRQVLVPRDEADLERVAGGLIRRARLVREHPELLPRYLAGMAALERDLEAAVAERLGGDRSVYPALVVSTAVTVVRLVLHRWDADGRARPLRNEIDEAFALVAAGLSRSPALVGDGS